MSDRRKIEENFFKGLMVASSLLILLILFFILSTILIKGFGAFSLQMITELPKGGFYLGKEGGILNAIAGSLFLIAGSVLIATVLSLPIVLYVNLYRKKRSKFGFLIRFTLDVLWGVPSIVYGAMGFILMIFFGLKTSLLGGILTISLFILPVISRGMDEIVKTVPQELLDASYSLGATRFETAFKVVIRQSLTGIITSILIAVGRGIGDAASVMFTAGYSDSIPNSLLKPVATLPLAIFYQLGTPIEAVQKRAYASALILTIIILTISVISRILIRKYTKFVIK